jgi:hypothetical protein
MRVVVIQVDAGTTLSYEIDRDTNLMNVFSWTGIGVITTDPDFDLTAELSPGAPTGGRVFYEIVRVAGDFVMAPIFLAKGTKVYLVAAGQWSAQLIFDDALPQSTE